MVDQRRENSPPPSVFVSAKNATSFLFSFACLNLSRIAAVSASFLSFSSSSGHQMIITDSQISHVHRNDNVSPCCFCKSLSSFFSSNGFSPRDARSLFVSSTLRDTSPCPVSPIALSLSLIFFFRPSMALFGHRGECFVLAAIQMV